ncbi:alpha/beta hydrolase [Streptomyces sp. NPDC001617]
MAGIRESSTVYEAADGSELPMLAFELADGTHPAAGVVLFHGGALHKGSPDGLAPHCRQLALRGIFAVSAGYRLLGHGAMGIVDCVADVRRAVERFGRLAASRGLDASRLASGGSSAGGHLALVAAMISPVGPCPAAEPGGAAIVALNPPVDLAFSPERQHLIEEDIGIAAGRAIDYSPIEFVRSGNPPMLIQHGTADKIVPIDQVRQFRDAMVQVGNDCVLLEYERAQHGFHYPANGGHFAAVMDASAEFLLARLAAF